MIYHIEKELVSPATKVIYAYDVQTNQPVCLKMWLRCVNEVYDTSDLNKCTGFLIDGLAFNRQLAPDVYLGICEVISMDAEKNELLCGPLIEEPERNTVKIDCEYALVMKLLDETKRLDHLLNSDNLGNEQGIDFLAQAIAEMHKILEDSPADMGTPARLITKFQRNCAIFNKI